MDITKSQLQGNKDPIKANDAEQEYQELVLLLKYRDLLLKRQQNAARFANSKISRLEKSTKPKQFGWKRQESISNPNDDLEEIWNKLYKLESMDYGLEDEQNIQELFQSMQEYLIGNELKGIDPQKLEQHYPHLLPTKKLTKNTEPMVKKPIMVPIKAPKKESTSQKYIKSLLAQKEQEQLDLVNFKVPRFHAKPPPKSTFSSPLPVVQNKSFELRLKSNKQKEEVDGDGLEITVTNGKSPVGKSEFGTNQGQLNREFSKNQAKTRSQSKKIKPIENKKNVIKRAKESETEVDWSWIPKP